MGAPTSLLGNARAFAKDFPRDNMPPGYLWDVADYVPTNIDAILTGRGGWVYGSDGLGADPETGIYAPFSTGDKLIVQTAAGRMIEVNPTTSAIVDRGPLPRARQNPVQLVDTVIHFDSAGTMPPRLITASAGAVNTPGAIAGAHPNSPLGVVYKSMLVTAAAPGELDVVRFSNLNKPLTDPASFDNLGFTHTSLPVTAIGALRSVILIFHPGSVERIRGSTAPHTGGLGDMFLESLFDRAGCIDPLSIAYWNDNCVFADEHGVHITDGSVIRNLAAQGGILFFWRQLYLNKITPLAACTFLDYYIISLRRSDGIVVTLICDLNKRQWFRFTNLNAQLYLASASGVGMERIWAGLTGTGRLARIGPCFFPSFTTAQVQDGDGTAVLPSFETPWYRLSREEGKKRSRFAYLSYDVRSPGSAPSVADDYASSWRFSDDDDVAPPPPGVIEQAVQQTLQVGYIRSPQQQTYTSIGTLPSTSEYSRYRLPLGQFSYGIGFQVKQLLPTTVTRVFDLGVEAYGAERSRV